MLTQTALIAQAEYTPVCGQCKFFDSYRNVCEGKLVPWEYDRTKSVRPVANSTDATCDRYIERTPF